MQFEAYGYKQNPFLYTKSIATDYANIGLSYLESGDITQASEFFQKAKVMHEEINDTNSLDMAILYHNIALVHGAKAEYDQAIETMKQSLVISTKIYDSSHPCLRRSLNFLEFFVEAKEDPSFVDELARKQIRQSINQAYHKYQQFSGHSQPEEIT